MLNHNLALIFIFCLTVSQHMFMLDNGWQEVHIWDINGTPEEIEEFCDNRLNEMHIGDTTYVNLHAEDLDRWEQIELKGEKWI